MSRAILFRAPLRDALAERLGFSTQPRFKNVFSVEHFQLAFVAPLVFLVREELVRLDLYLSRGCVVLLVRELFLDFTKVIVLLCVPRLRRGRNEFLLEIAQLVRVPLLVGAGDGGRGCEWGGGARAGWYDAGKGAAAGTGIPPPPHHPTRGPPRDAPSSPA